MNKAKDRLIQAWNENPLAVIAIASLAATAASKLINASTERANSRTWAKEVDRRRMNTARS